MLAWADGTLTPVERAEVESWLAETAVRARMAERVRLAWQVAAQTAPDAWDGEAMWQGVERRRSAHSAKAFETWKNANGTVQRLATGRAREESWRARFWRRQLLRRSLRSGVVVAAIAIVAMILNTRTHVTPTARPQHYATAVGQRLTVTLADGSRATLAPQTTLVVSAQFGTTHRAVTLYGEAYFDVTHTRSSPFIVRTGNIVTHVLGTTFDVTHYTNDRDVRVVVTSGRVVVNTPHHPAVTLAGGSVGHVTDSTATVSATGDAMSYTTWTTGKLDFREVPVVDILATLSRWYGIRFVLTDTTLAQHRVTTLLDYANSSDLVIALEAVLEVTATSTATKDGPVITLKPRHSTAPSGHGRNQQRDTYSPTWEAGR